MIQKLLLLISCCNFATYLFAQVSFTAQINSKQVTQYSYFEIKFTLNNARAESFTPPSFTNFNIVSGPNRSVSTTIVNGVYSSEMGYSFVLQPEKKGNFTIGSATVKADGKTYRTEPMTIEVVESKKALGKSGNGQNQDVFLEAEFPTDKVYIGQQIPLSYKIYTRTDISSYNILQESDYQGFYAEDTRTFDVVTAAEMVNGVKYITKVLKQVALFPQRTGELVIEPMQMQLGISKSEPVDPRDFFFTPELERIEVLSEAVKLHVKPLPDGAPASFTGAVGIFNFASSVQHDRISTDDGLPIRVSLTGTGDMKRVSPPIINLGDAFEVYEPKILEERAQETNGEIQTRRVYEYIALPKKTGEHLLQIEFSYFDTEEATYKTINSEPAIVTVVQGFNAAKSPLSGSNNNQLDADIRFVKTGASLQKPSQPLLHSAGFWIALLLPFVLFGGLIAFKRKQQQHNLIDPTLLKNKQAQKIAQQHLSSAKQHLEHNESRAFFNAISKAMLGYVNDKLNIPNAELTKNNVVERLQHLKVSESIIEQFMNIIQTCEMALFALQDNPSEMKNIYETTISLLVDMEKTLSKS